MKINDEMKCFMEKFNYDIVSAMQEYFLISYEEADDLQYQTEWEDVFQVYKSAQCYSDRYGKAWEDTEVTFMEKTVIPDVA